MSTTTLSRRAINRATLDRQLLPRRADLPVPDAIELLVGPQAQTPHSWYHALEPEGRVRQAPRRTPDDLQL